MVVSQQIINFASIKKLAQNKIMEALSEDMFFDANAVSSVDDSCYENLGLLGQTLDSLSNLMYQSVYVVDYYRKNYFYVPKNPLVLEGLFSERMQREGLGAFLGKIPKDERAKLFELHRAGFELFGKLPMASRRSCVVFCDFHLVNDGFKVLINHRQTPLVLTEAGELWLALCLNSLSPHKSVGHAEFRIDRDNKVWEYSFDAHQWHQKDIVVLSSEEKKLLFYAAQGYSREEIAVRLHKSVNTVKLYRKKMFERMKVSNITEAISYAAAYGLM